MNTKNIPMFLFITLTGVISLTLFVYLGSLLFEFFKTPVEPFENERDAMTEALSSGGVRRKFESNMNAVSTLHINQQGLQKILLSLNF